MFQKLFINKFTEVLIIAVVALLCSTSWLCYQNKSKEQQLIVAGEKLHIQQQENQQMANQLENANLQISQYQQQVKALHDNVLSKLQQAEGRTNEIINELENHKNWRDQPVPSNVERLLNQRSKNH